MTGHKRDWAACGVFVLLLLLPLVLYWPFVFGGKALFWGTPLLQFWPWRGFAAEELRAGRLPLWNPYAGNGLPLLADHQSAVFYPPNLIFWLLPVERALGLSLVFHAILAGGAMYAFARELGLTRLGGMVSALAFMFSGYMVARGSFLTEVSALPWLPLLLLYGRRLVRRGRGVDGALLAGVVALQFLAGHAQTWFYSLCALALYGLWETGSQIVRGRARKRDRALRAGMRALLLLAAVAWGVGLAAAQFLPTLELSQAAGRAGREGWDEHALQYSLWPWRLITLLLPDFFGSPAQGDYWGYATYWEDAGHIGVLPFLFALLAIATWIRRRRFVRANDPILGHVPVFALLAGFSLLMALGKNTPLYLFFYRYVPGFDLFQAPARWLSVYTAAIATLAGVGADALRPSHRLTFVCRLGAAGGVAIALTTTAAKRLLPGVKATFFDPLTGLAIWYVAAMLVFLWGQEKTLRIGRWRLGPRAWQAGVLILIAADLILAGYDLNPAVDPSLYAPSTATGALLQADGLQGRTFYTEDVRQALMFESYLDFGDFGPDDLAHWWGMRELLLPDLGMVERLPSANTFEPLVEGRYDALMEAIGKMPREDALRVLGLMNVAYVLDPAPDLGGEIIYRSPAADVAVNVYRNPYLLPRAYVVCQGRVAGSAEEALSAVLSPAFDPAQEVILEGSDRISALDGSPQAERCARQPVTLLPSAPNQVTIRAVLSQPGYLVLADTFYPGWRAFVDDRPVQVWRANYAFRAVAVDAGGHEIRFQYRPRSFVLGAAISGAALLGVVVLGIDRLRKREIDQA